MPLYELLTVLNHRTPKDQLARIFGAVGRGVMQRGGVVRPFENLGCAVLPYRMRSYNKEWFNIGRYFIMRIYANPNNMLRAMTQIKESDECIRVNVVRMKEEWRLNKDGRRRIRKIVSDKKKRISEGLEEWPGSRDEEDEKMMQAWRALSRERRQRLQMEKKKARMERQAQESGDDAAASDSDSSDSSSSGSSSSSDADSDADTNAKTKQKK